MGLGSLNYVCIFAAAIAGFVFGGIWYRLQGADQATARTHTTIAVPGATGASLGLPENGKEGVLWVMDAGTSTAHLMIPGQ